MRLFRIPPLPGAGHAIRWLVHSATAIPGLRETGYTGQYCVDRLLLNCRL